LIPLRRLFAIVYNRILPPSRPLLPVALCLPLDAELSAALALASNSRHRPRLHA
jgi:hypothetical protein